MKSIADNKEHNIEFKHITGQDMLEEVKQLFLEYAQVLYTSCRNYYQFGRKSIVSGF